MIPDPEVLRTYASIFRRPRRVDRDGALLPPTEIMLAAAEALEFRANFIEWALPPSSEEGKYEDQGNPNQG